MTFQEMINEEGLYKTASFHNGYALKVTKNKRYNDYELTFVNYKDKNDFFIKQHKFVLTNTLVNADFEKVFTRQQLFK